MDSDPQSRGFVSHAATYAVGNIARRVVGFAMLPIYTRFLTPADYGVVGLMAFALALFEPIFGARLGRAMPKYYFEATDARARRAVIWGGIGLTSVVSAISMVAIILLRGLGAEILFGGQKYGLALGLFSVNLLTRPLEDTGLMYLRIKQRSRLFLGFSITKLILQLSLNLLLLIYWRLGVVGVVLSGIISSLAIGVGLVAYIAINEPPVFEWHVTRSMVKLCWPLWLSGLAGLYIGSSAAIYLRVFDTLSDVGRLELAMKFATVVGMLCWSPFFQHWEPESYKYYKEPDGKRKFQVAFIGISTLMFAGGLSVSIFEPVIRMMAAKSFYPAAGIVPILTLGFILNSLKSFFNFSFLVTEHTKIQSFCQYATAIVVTCAYLVLIPPFGLAGAAVGLCMAFSFSFIFVRLISRRYYDPGFTLLPIGAFGLIGLVAYIVSNVLFQKINPWSDLLIKSLALLIGSCLIALTGIRSILKIDATALESLPWPFYILSGVSFKRESDRQNKP